MECFDIRIVECFFSVRWSAPPSVLSSSSPRQVWAGLREQLAEVERCQQQRVLLDRAQGPGQEGGVQLASSRQRLPASELHQLEQPPARLVNSSDPSATEACGSGPALVLKWILLCFQSAPGAALPCRVDLGWVGGRWRTAGLIKPCRCANRASAASTTLSCRSTTSMPTPPVLQAGSRTPDCCTASRSDGFVLRFCSTWRLRAWQRFIGLICNRCC